MEDEDEWLEFRWLCCARTSESWLLPLSIETKFPDEFRTSMLAAKFAVRNYRRFDVMREFVQVKEKKKRCVEGPLKPEYTR